MERQRAGSFFRVQVIALFFVLAEPYAFAQTTHHITTTDIPHLNLAPGDSVLFERGKTYAGPLVIAQSGTAVRPIHVGAYGTGDAPVITGAQRIDEWATHSGNIKKAALDQAPAYAIVNDQLLPQARWPNVDPRDSGMVYNQNGTNTKVTTTALSSAPDLTGARMHIRNTAWSFETRTITSHSGTTVNFPWIPETPAGHAFGLWFTGKLSLLDQMGEWYYDEATRTVYVMSMDPSQIEWVIADEALLIGYRKEHITITGLHLKGAVKHVVYMQEARNITITNCRISHGFDGVKIASGDGPRAANNKVIGSEIHDIYDRGISMHLADNTIIEDNYIHDIGMMPGLSQDGWGNFGIATSGVGVVVRRNRIENVGYIGIASGGNDLIEKNSVTNYCMVLNDGGGIALDHADGLIIRDNIVDCELPGTLAGCPLSYHGCGLRRKGIYFGENSMKNISVSGNTILNAEGPCVFVDNSMDADNNNATNNICLNCNEGMSQSEWGNRNQPPEDGTHVRLKYDHTITGNVVIIGPGQLAGRQINAHAPEIRYGTIDRNIFYGTPTFVRNGKSYSLEQWQAATGNETNSQVRPLGEWVAHYATSQPRSVTLTGQWRTHDGTAYSGTIILEPFTALVLQKVGD